MRSQIGAGALASRGRETDDAAWVEDKPELELERVPEFQPDQEPEPMTDSKQGRMWVHLHPEMCEWCSIIASWRDRWPGLVTPGTEGLVVVTDGSVKRHRSHVVERFEKEIRGVR